MVKTHLKFFMPACLILFMFGLTSCSDDELSAFESSGTTFDATAFEDASLTSLKDQTNAGRGGCYELVFPISIQFADDSTLEFTTYESLRGAIRQWKEANSDATEKPELVFPIELISENGEVLTANSKNELRALKQACRGAGHHGPHRGREACFDLVFPVTVNFSDGSNQSFENRMSLKDAVRAWVQENGREDRPTLEFPIEVALEDGSVQSVNSQEELRALKQSCRQG